MKKLVELFSAADQGKELDIKTLSKQLASVEGQISNEELFFLYKAVLSAGRSATIVEIGSYKGKSALALGLAARLLGSRVYSIDPHEHYTGVAGGVFGPNDLKDKIANIHKFDLGHVIFPVCLGSHEVGKIWNTPIDICWIDGDHSYAGVKGDFEYFAPKVKPGGLLLFHDSGMEGVARLLSEISDRDYLKADSVGSITCFRKRN